MSSSYDESKAALLQALEQDPESFKFELDQVDEIYWVIASREGSPALMMPLD